MRYPTVNDTATQPPARTVHVEHCMGTAFTIDIRDPGEWDDAVHAAAEWLHHVDAVFSTYKRDSDISRMQRAELTATAADPDVLTVLDLCARVQIATDGYFTAMPHRKLDPTGVVKGWAIERASHLLRAFGSRNHAVNGGGDMQLSGEAAPGRLWTVGITDPHDRSRVLSVVSGRDIAVATSGPAERGDHIIDPRTGRPATGVASATVAGPSLALVDAYATAAFVMGRDALRWISSIDGYEALLVGDDTALRASGRWHRLAAMQ
jgi:thiamine biosynthesis lipoprotein